MGNQRFIVRTVFYNNELRDTSTLSNERANAKRIMWQHIREGGYKHRDVACSVVIGEDGRGWAILAGSFLTACAYVEGWAV